MPLAAIGTSRTSGNVRLEFAKWAKADIDQVARRFGLRRRPRSRGVSEAKNAKLGRKIGSRERDELFDSVSCRLRDARPHPGERACKMLPANSNGRARVSKDEDERTGAPSCFETHRSVLCRGSSCGRVALRCSSA